LGAELHERIVIISLENHVKRYDREEVDSKPALKIYNSYFLFIDYFLLVLSFGYGGEKRHKNVDQEPEVD
jgi:hypothetical protein